MLETLPTLPEEIWKEVPGWEGFYAVSNLGRVYSLRVNRLITRCVNKRGYFQIQLHNHSLKVTKNKPVHLLVLETFEGPRPVGMVARHLDDVKLNCALSNLEWATPKVNIADNLDNNKVRSQKLTVAQVREIRSRTWSSAEIVEFCNSIGIETQAFYKAQTGRTFKHVEM